MEYNALIREYSGKSLKVLARVQIEDFKDIPQDWKITYRSKEVSKSSTTVQDLCCCPTNPLQIYKPVKDGFPITVRTMDGKAFEVVVSPTDTLKLLKLKIFQVDDSYPPDLQELHINMKNSEDETLLIDWCTIEFFRITARSTVYLRVDSKAFENLQSDVKFKPINVKRTLINSYAHFASPTWVRYSAGMNFGGYCPNPRCESKELGVEREVVARPFPYGDLRINFTCQEENPLECPACSSLPDEIGEGDEKDESLEEKGKNRFPIKPKTLIFAKCRAVSYYRLADGKQVMERYFQAKLGEASEFCEVESKIKLMEVTSVEPWRSPYICVRCDVPIMYKAHEHEMSCGHKYHNWCKPSVWSGMKCKVCHAQALTTDKLDEILKMI